MGRQLLRHLLRLSSLKLGEDFQLLVVTRTDNEKYFTGNSNNETKESVSWVQLVGAKYWRKNISCILDFNSL